MQVELSEIPLVADTAFGAGALKGEAIRQRSLADCEPLINRQRRTSAARRSRLLRGDESLRLALWVKIDENIIFLESSTIMYPKDSH